MGGERNNYKHHANNVADEARILRHNKGKGATLSSSTWGRAQDNHARRRFTRVGELDCQAPPRRHWLDGLEPYGLPIRYCRAIDEGRTPAFNMSDLLNGTMKRHGVGA